ncbi:MAG: DNA alkylation repair protein [Cytophagaceae bacterium]|nr:DNA alkylation repair protein [Cytophagaceae bacterium]
METLNLVEALATNQVLLLKNVLSGINRAEYFPVICQSCDNLKSKTIMTLVTAIGKGLLAEALRKKEMDFILEKFSTHPNDFVRSWAVYMIGINENIKIEEKLKAVYPFAGDKHFGVREMAWMAVRPSVAKELKKSIKILSRWSKDKNENIRRFASEVSRPRGVWCKHIDELKENPELAISILETLKADQSKYVQNSVGNWLNDASKSKPAWVKKICKEWKKEKKKETDYIIKKGLRSINK